MIAAAPSDERDPGAGVGGFTPDVLDGLTRLPGKLGPLPLPEAASTTERAAIDLGRRLFFDPRLSGDQGMSCATCHDPDKAFADGLPLSRGFGGKTLRRHAPTVLNAVHNSTQFWDGRAKTLAIQAAMPIMSGDEMAMPTEAQLVRRIDDDPAYAAAFRTLYGGPPSLSRVGEAIAAFEATLVTPDSPFDHYERGDRSALTLQQKRGLALFVGKASCSLCHSGPNLTDSKFHNLGLADMKGAPPDLGRFEVTKNAADMRAFKTPTLRNVSLSAPYLHDGSAATLEDVIDLYNRGGGPQPVKSDLVFALGLTPEEKSDLIAFLHSLTGTLPAIARK